MALNFTVSAPGKVILHGEHSVVYGRPALAGVIGLGNTLNFKANNPENLIFDFPVLNIFIKLPITTVNAFLGEMYEIFHTKQLPKEINHEDFLLKVKNFVFTKCFTETPTSVNEKAMCSTIYLLTGILISVGCSELKYGFTIVINSELSVGAGLGSSASFGVCLASAFYFFSMSRIKPDFIDNFNKDTSIVDKNFVKNNLSNWAFCSEKIMHGNPSGLDNTICTFGNVVQFSKGQTPIFLNMKKPLNILLVNTDVSRSTVNLVQKVVDLKDKHPTLVNHILDAMGELVYDVIDVLNNIDDNEMESYNNLKRLVTMNNNLLRTLNVSHPSLEKIFSICDNHGYSSKLTGAGGGGFATVLLPSDYSTLDGYHKLYNELNDNGFKCIATTIGGPGMNIELH